MKPRTSERAGRFTESVIREMTRLANLHGAVNLAQGFPDFSAPEEMKEAAARAIRADLNQYSITWGTKNLREAIAQRARKTNGIPCDPETEITVCCGSTEAMISALLGTVNPGDEVVVFEPFYENYGPDAILSGAVPRFVKLREPDWSFDPQELRAAFNNKTKAIVVNTPNNPTGKVFTRKELEVVAELCRKWNSLAITDEIYEYILYDDARHLSIATLEGMRDRTVTISGASKTFSCTGWRIGYAIASPEITGAIRKVHDFLTVGAPHPLQEAVAMAMSFQDDFYEKLRRDYRERRQVIYEGLGPCGFGVGTKPGGAYYLMAGISSFGFPNDTDFARYLVEKVGVAVVPGSSFYNNPRDGYGHVRFAFCKKVETLREALGRLRKLEKPR